MKYATKQKPEEDRAADQAKAQLGSIIEMVEALKAAEDSDNEQAREDAMQTINEDPLSVEVRSDWHSPGDTENSKPSEYRILLCWGGPAVQIVGDLGEYGEPESATLQYQDWFTKWADYPLTSEQEQVVITYAQQFYFEC